VIDPIECVWEHYGIDKIDVIDEIDNIDATAVNDEICEWWLWSMWVMWLIEVIDVIDVIDDIIVIDVNWCDWCELMALNDWYDRGFDRMDMIDVSDGRSDWCDSADWYTVTVWNLILIYEDCLTASITSLKSTAVTSSHISLQ